MPLTRIKTTAIDHVFLSEFLGTVASESAMLALVGGIGDYAVRSDLNNDAFIITQNNGSSIGDWQKISNTSTALLKSENLSDLPDAATARGSLGLGTAATNDTGDFLQVANNLNDLNNSDTALDNLGFSSFGKTLIDDVDAAAVRTTLGLGEVATLDVAGGAQDFVATGAISAGQIVGLRSDGTIEVVADTIISETENLGASTIFENASTNNISATFDPSQNKIVIAYEDSANSYGTAVVGTVSGSSISFGTPVVFTYSSADHITALFDPSTNKVVIVYRIPSSSGGAIVGTVTGNSISFGSAAGFGNYTINNVTATFDSINDKVIVFYSYTQSYNEPRVMKGTILANGISFSGEIKLATGATAGIDNFSATFDSSQNKVVIAYRDVAGNNSYGTARVVTVSGTSISVGAPVVFESSNTFNISATFDSSQNKVVIAYQNGGNNNYGTAVVGTVSGTSITFGPSDAFSNASTNSISSFFDSNLNKVLIAYSDAGNNNYGTVLVGTIVPGASASQDSITFGPPVVFSYASTNSISATFSYRNLIAYQDDDNSGYGTAVVYTTSGNYTTVNADSWIGIASQNISDGDSGPVTIFSGVNENQTGLNPNTIYYVNYDGTLTATENAGPLTGTYGKIGRALSSTKLLITEGNDIVTDSTNTVLDSAAKLNLNVIQPYEGQSLLYKNGAWVNEHPDNVPITIPVDIIVVAGGGGGGDTNSGGGGAGGFREFQFNFSQSTIYSVSVGAGGANNYPGGNQGSSSSITIGGTAYTSTGGGAGGGSTGGNGGSGGGGQSTAGTGNPNGYTPSEGNNGGVSAYPNNGGGGGVGSAGSGRNGGAGTTWNGKEYAGGGGGGSTAYYNGWNLAGYSSASHGGGRGAGAYESGGSYQFPAGENGAANTGGGAGGGLDNVANQGGRTTGGSGGSGVIVIMYEDKYPNLKTCDPSLTILGDSTLTGVVPNPSTRISGYKIYEILSGSGDISW